MPTETNERLVADEAPDMEADHKCPSSVDFGHEVQSDSAGALGVQSVSQSDGAASRAPQRLSARDFDRQVAEFQVRVIRGLSRTGGV